jgi:CheY-like chemotaxis protein
VNEVQTRPHARVFVIDDNPDAADTLGMLLRQWGYDVEVYYDGQAALARAHAVRPECMLVDIGLPRMNGYEIARKIRERAELAEMKLVAVTAYRDEPAARRAGFDYYFAKPADLTKVAELLDAILSSRRLAMSE